LTGINGISGVLPQTKPEIEKSLPSLYFAWAKNNFQKFKNNFH
jgi:hypothetical protein